MIDNSYSISCVVPTFNRPEYLLRALNSIVNQSYQPQEVIICENGESERVKEIVASFQNRDTKIIHLSSRTELPALDNWLRGVLASTSRFIKIVWDDDWLEVNCLHHLRSLAISKSADVVISASWMVLPEGRFLAYQGENFETSDFKSVLSKICQRKLPNSPLAALIRREDLVEAFMFNGFPDNSVSHGLVVGPDLAANFWALLKGGKLVFTNEPMVNMFSDGFNMTQSNVKKLPKFYRLTVHNLMQYHFGRVTTVEKLTITLWNNARFYPTRIISIILKLLVK